MPVYFRRLANLFMLMPARRLPLRKASRSLYRSDLAGAVTREFCAECGTHLVTRRPGLPPRS